MLLGTGTANAATGSWTSGSTTVVLTDDGVCTVSGRGAMANYGSDDVPWSAFRDAIRTLVIKEGVTSIGNYAFFNCRGLTSVTIPDYMTSIGNYAFGGCRGLTSLTIPDGVTSIGNYAFGGCSGLTAINVDDANAQYSSVEGVVYNKNKTALVFYPAGKQGAFTIPTGVTSIGETAFGGCSGLTSVTIPNSVTSIGGIAYDITPESVTVSGSGAFAECSGLTSITIPNSVTSIGNGAFVRCRGLTSVTISDGVTSIGESAFAECSGLTSITIPSSVTSIGESAFFDCSGLTAINVDVANAQYSSVEGVVYNKNKTALVCYSGGKQGAFTIPNSVTSIGSGAFAFCIGLTSVTIPNSVTSIGRGAFRGYSGLTSVFCLAATPPTLDEANFTVSTDTLYVPERALHAYKNNGDWSSAFDIILPIESATSVKTVDADKLHVYPNPTTGVVYVDNANGAEVKVYNLNGALLHRTRESRVDLSGEPSGIYLLRVGGETLKVVKK
ncbi:hypothetical protein AGMMS4957_12450 [Bacteroidia bacterium]|nr:hypothetical protein AGMMS4957_12450 [Bacteroidia bacterium]